MATKKSFQKLNEEKKMFKKQRKEAALLKTIATKIKSEAINQNYLREEKQLCAPSTISIAVPGSILENTQSVELRTYVAGQIARAACIFRINEVIVFDDIGIATDKNMKRHFVNDSIKMQASENTSFAIPKSSLQLARILQYLECPQYLRKFFFPIHKDLKYSGLLNPLDAPHHLRLQSEFPYREGIVSEKKAKEGHSYANVGLFNEVLVNRPIAPGIRITVKLENQNTKKIRGRVVSPDEPRNKLGVYWGYNVRIAHSLSEVFTKSPYKDGYDLTVGTSDRGSSIYGIPDKSLHYNHLLIVFGGLAGLENALSSEEGLQIDDPTLLFDHYVNVLPHQGSRTIRTEEALLVGLSAFQEKLQPQVPDVKENISNFLPRSEDTGLSHVYCKSF